MIIIVSCLCIGIIGYSNFTVALVLLLILLHRHKSLKILIVVILAFTYTLLFNSLYLSADIPEKIIVSSDIVVSEKYTTFISQNNLTKLKVYDYASSSYNYGDILACKKTNIEIKNKFNNPSSFNYTEYMKSIGVNKIISISNCSVIGKSNNIFYYMRSIRDNLLKHNISIYEKSSFLINSLFLGENKFSDEFEKLSSNLGISHVFSISGTHVAVVTAICWMTLASLNIHERKIKFVLNIILILFFILAGESTSVFRACFTQLIIYNLNTKYSKLNITLVLASLSLIINPFIIHNIGFVLSYLITIFICYFIIEKNVNINPTRTTFMINILLLPIIVNMNYNINPFIIIANLVLIPLVTFVLLPFSIFATFIDLSIFDKLIYLIYSTISYFLGLLDIFTMTIANFSVIGFTIYYSLLYFVYTRKLKSRYIILFLLLHFVNFSFLGYISFIDINQGKAILIKVPVTGETILIDTGSARYQEELINYLHYEGISRIDHLFITHFHEDHYGGFDLLNNEFKISNLYTSLGDKKITNSTILKDGDTLTISNISIQILSPTTLSDNPNDNSLVLYFTIGGTDILITGDTETIGEQHLIDTYDFNVDILDVAHHGSDTSTKEDFLEKFSPDIAVIQCGSNNMYSHPSKNVLDRLELHGSNILRTDEDGLIKITLYPK